MRAEITTKPTTHKMNCILCGDEMKKKEENDEVFWEKMEDVIKDDDKSFVDREGVEEGLKSKPSKRFNSGSVSSPTKKGYDDDFPKPKVFVPLLERLDKRISFLKRVKPANEEHARLLFSIYNDLKDFKSDFVECLQEKNNLQDLAVQCQEFRGVPKCGNAKCLNKSCQLHKDFDYDKSFLGEAKEQ